MTTNRTTIGAALGAAIALTWLTFDTAAVIILITLTVIGALIGTALDNPQRLINALQRLQDNQQTLR